jgi:hypothetical protein
MCSNACHCTMSACWRPQTEEDHPPGRLYSQHQHSLCSSWSHASLAISGTRQTVFGSKEVTRLLKPAPELKSLLLSRTSLPVTALSRSTVEEGLIVGQSIIHKLLRSPTALGIRARNEDFVCCSTFIIIFHRKRKYVMEKKYS